MRSIIHIFVAFGIVLSLAASVGISPQARPTIAAAVPPVPQTENVAVNLLINGDMEMQPYTWYYPNHYVAPYWRRWWYYYSVIPEYDDTRGGPRPNCGECDGGTHAQVYFKWGPSYQAGIYQRVTGLTPCTPYELSAYARSHSLEGVLPHARVGLDPQGTDMAPGSDGGIFSFPPYTAWSAEQTTLFVWEKLSVRAEPLGNSLTAILYAAPQPASNRTHYYDSYWDAAVLEPQAFPDNHLPAPDSWTPSGFIYDVQTQKGGNSLTVSWKTRSAASTQVRYEIVPYQPVTPITSTIIISLTYQVYLPFVSRDPVPSPHTFTRYTALDTTPVTDHQVIITDIQAGDIVMLVPLSRRPTATTCTTETYYPLVIKFDGP
ncbi:MAG TPA: hypothetical protein PLJ78_12280 [Anaerolineae bacterium]|nr:hypothetical protein [Anaerolineae bacterium]HQK14707.1 hypothetical protein [Anaerolineae bacterium]